MVHAPPDSPCYADGIIQEARRYRRSRWDLVGSKYPKSRLTCGSAKTGGGSRTGGRRVGIRRLTGHTGGRIGRRGTCMVAGHGAHRINGPYRPHNADSATTPFGGTESWISGCWRCHLHPETSRSLATSAEGFMRRTPQDRTLAEVEVDYRRKFQANAAGDNQTNEPPGIPGRFSMRENRTYRSKGRWGTGLAWRAPRP